MKRLLILLFCFIPFWIHAQTDILVLQKRGMHLLSFTVNDVVKLKTSVTGSEWLEGPIEDMRHDSVYLEGQVFSYKDITAIQRTRTKSGLMLFGSAAWVIAGGIIVLGAVNGGLVRHDPAREWYTTSGLVTAGVMAVAGYFMRNSYVRTYHLGGRFKLVYLVLNPRRK